jgi:hypothetical protein
MGEKPVFEADREALLRSAGQELKTPLTVIRGCAEGLAEGVFTAEEAADTILGESFRLECLIRALLDVARIERDCFSARREPIDLMAVGRAAVARREGAARKNGVGVVFTGRRPRPRLPDCVEPGRMRRAKGIRAELERGGAIRPAWSHRLEHGDRIWCPPARGSSSWSPGGLPSRWEAMSRSIAISYAERRSRCASPGPPSRPGVVTP